MSVIRPQDRPGEARIAALAARAALRLPLFADGPPDGGPARKPPSGGMVLTCDHCGDRARLTRATFGGPAAAPPGWRTVDPRGFRDRITECPDCAVASDLSPYVGGRS